MHEKGKLSAEWARLNKPLKILEVRETNFDIKEDAMKIENSQSSSCINRLAKCKRRRLL